METVAILFVVGVAFLFVVLKVTEYQAIERRKRDDK
jgi:hypothetical protein